jgi:beta-galactosidase/evolved beta-galactosidase subunit alpha
LIEYKKVIEPVKVVAEDILKGKVRVTNHYDFASLEHLAVSWTLTQNGKVIESGTLPSLTTRARTSEVITVPFQQPATLLPGGEYFLNLRFTLKSDTLWAQAGHEIALGQLAMPFKAPAIPAVDLSAFTPLEIEEDPTTILITGGNFEIEFDRVKGTIVNWTFNDLKIVRRGPQLNFWRVPTDNDRHFDGFGFAQVWKNARLDAMMHRIDRCEIVKREADKVIVTVEAYIAPPVERHGFTCKYTYTIYTNGDVVLNVTGQPRGKMPHLPRIGLQMTLPEEFSTADWFGRGPGESYADTQEANLVGRYQKSVADLFTNYVFPQENGNRQETRWVALTNRQGEGLLASATPWLHFTASPYSPKDLEKARHRNELTVRDEIALNLDYKQCGIGSGSCGPETFEPYRIPAEAFDFTVRLRAFAKSEIAPEQLYQQRNFQK